MTMNLNLKGTIIKEILELKYIKSDLTERALVEGNLIDFFNGCSVSYDNCWRDFYKYLIKKTDNAVLGNRLENLIKLIWANPIKITDTNVYTVDGYKWGRVRSIFIYYKVKNGFRIYHKNPDGSVDKFDEKNKCWIFE